MKTEQTLSANESLDIISRMVDKARFNFSCNSFYFIMWGGLLVLAAAFQWLAIETALTPYYWAGWPVVGVIGGVYSAVKGRQISKEQGHETHLDRMYGLIWVFFFITLAVMLIALVRNNLEPSGYIMVMTGFPTILTGKLIRFSPLVIGGVMFWVFGAIALFILPDLTTQLFIVSMFTGYLIPGIMMRRVKDV